jgi:RND family efflux transporter MFP subunit
VADHRFLPRPTWLSPGLAVALCAVVSGCATTASTPPVQSPSQPVTVAVQPATRGNIEQTLAYSGDIRAREQVSILPRSTGRIARVLADVGTRVRTGEAIAVIEQDDAQISAFQARANLAGAEAKLATLQRGPRAEDVAAAQASLIQQQSKFQNMQAGGRAEDIQLAQAALDAQRARLDQLQAGGRPEAIQQAQDAVDSANAKLSSVQKGAAGDVRQSAQSAVDADKAALSSAEAAYAALGGSNAADLQVAQSQADTLSAQLQAAQASVTSADAALKNLQGSAPADLQQAQSAYESALAQLQAAQAALDQGKHPTQASVAETQSALAQAQAQHAAAEANQAALEQGVAQPCADTPVAPGVTIHHNGTACGEAKTSADAAVQAASAAVDSAQGQLDLLKRGGSPSQQAQLQAGVDQARANVAATKLRLEALKSGGIDAQRAQLQATREDALSQLTAGQENLVVAQARLDAIKNGTQDAQVKNAASQVTAAAERLKSDQARLDQLVAGPTEEDLQQAQASVDQAQQQLALATHPSTEQDIRAQQAAVQQAQLQLLKARQPFTDADLEQQQQAVNAADAQLAKAQNPYSEQDLAAAQATVDQARAQLQLAELGLSETTITAPVDGVIAERLVAPGALVNPQTAIATLVPPALELLVNVDESQLGQVAEGQGVQLQVPAYPSETFHGTVKSIAPTIDPRSRTAAVRVEPNDDALGKLRAGMFARLTIVTTSKPDALLVPREAVQIGGAGSQPVVMVVDDTGLVHRQPVRLGLQNDTLDEIVAGLDLDQMVACSNLNNLNDGDVVDPQLEAPVASSGPTL